MRTLLDNNDATNISRTLTGPIRPIIQQLVCKFGVAESFRSNRTVDGNPSAGEEVRLEAACITQNRRTYSFAL
jgi:hypothetical protein